MPKNNSYRARRREHPKTKGREISELKGQLDSIKKLAERNKIAARSETIHFLEEHPTDMYGWFLLGHLEEQLENLSTAKTIYERVALSSSSNRYSAIIRLGDIAFKEGYKSQAKKYYQQAKKESPYEEKYATYRLASLESIDKNYDEAIRIIKTLRTIDNAAKLEILKYLLLQGKIDEAAETLDGIIPQTEEESRRIILERGRIANIKGDFQTAKNYFEQVIVSGPKDDNYACALFPLANICLEEKDYQTAINFCEELISLSQDFNKEVYTIIGTCKQNLGIYDQALENFQKGATSTDYRVRTESNYYLGLLQFMKGDFDDAIKSLKQSAEGDRSLAPGAIGMIVNAYVKRRDYIGARNYLEALKIENPKNYKKIYNPELIEIIIAKRLNEPLTQTENPSYAKLQAAKYDRNMALHHINNHHVDNGYNSRFSKKVNVEELFDAVKEQLTSENQVFVDLTDIYDIDYPEIGYDDKGNIINRLRVVTLPNTLDIITMFPAGEEASGIRQSDILKQITSSKPKVNSRIDKFNQRLALKTTE